jgi:hypothetical protein
MDFMTQVARVGKHMTTREQQEKYFQSQFPGETKWKSEFARRLQPYTKSPKTGQPLSYSNVRRRFEGDRLTRPVPEKLKGEYIALGKELPRMPPERGYHIKGTVCISINGYPCEQRTWDYKVVDSVAAYLYRTGSLQALVNVYMGDLPEEENPQAELCEEAEERPLVGGEEVDQEQDCKSKIKVTALSEKGQRHLPNIDQSR